MRLSCPVATESEFKTSTPIGLHADFHQIKPRDCKGDTYFLLAG